MGFLDKFTSRKIDVTIETTQITITDKFTGSTITRIPEKPYSCGRVIISDFLCFEDFLKEVISDLIPKGFFAHKYEMNVKVKHSFSTPLCEVEERAVLDSCEHAGARIVILNGKIN